MGKTARTPMHPRHLIGLTEAADVLGVSERSIRRYLADGTLRGWRVGPKLVRVDLYELERLIQPMPSAADGA